MNKKLNILIVNDDGFDAKGLVLLKDCLFNHNLYFSAPLTHQSAKSHSITYDKPLEIQNIKIDNSNFPAINVSGSPIDSLRVGMAHFSTDFDLVISGVNNGYNLSLDTFYSGTVAAAKEATLFGVKSVAISTTDIEKLEIDVLNTWFSYFFDYIYNTDFSVINVNIPSVSNEAILGIKVVGLDNFYSKTIFKVENNSYIPYLDKEFSYNLIDGDYYWFNKNYITITYLSFWNKYKNEIEIA